MKRYILLLLLTLLVPGCGGGGGASAAPATHSAVATLSTSGTPANAVIGDVDVTVNLPPGVTVRSAPKTGNPSVLVPASGVITLKGTAASATSQSLLDPTYQPGPPAKVTFRLISAGGLPVGDTLATITCDIAAGNNPVPGDFTVTPNIAPTGVFDLNAAALAGVNVQLSAVIN